MSRQTEAVVVPDCECAMPDAKTIGRLLDALGVTRCRLVWAWRRGGEWDEEEYDVEAKESELSKDEFVAFVGRHPGCYIDAEVDGLLQGLAESLRDRHPVAAGEWYPFTGTVKLGLHSYPDWEFEKTVWRGNVSLGLYGDGLAEPKPMRDGLASDPAWQKLMSLVSEILGIPTRFELILDY